jgi:hypothetical protein
MRTRSVLLIAAFVLSAFAASAADLTIDMQVNTAAKDYANNYLTFKGANNSVDKDQFVAAADGAIMVRYLHRGTAYEIVTDKAGQIALPTTTVRQRKIGHSDNQIHADFSSNGKPSGVDWAKVWNASIADGKQVGSTASKTGKISPDVAESDFFVLAGTLQVTFAGNILKIAGELNAVKK